ncbi:MAG TPA: glycosyltransferase [Oligoflexia bacterium]|nr:glycosyltransferase [Oligoflexia bacterium]HMP27019.1 glycosyltransferase [Oligoflexia bacterium]
MSNQAAENDLLTEPFRQTGDEPKESALEPSLSQINARLRSERDQLASELERVAAERDNLQNALNMILNSRAWKMALVCRKLASFLRRLFPLWGLRKINFYIKPDKQSYHDGREIQITGASSVLSLRPVGDYNGRFLPSGWVKIRFDFNSRQRDHEFFLLYFGGQKGIFSGNSRVWLSVFSGKNYEHVIYLPPPVADLRLDPLSGDFSFSYSEFYIKKIGSLELLWHLLRTKIFPLLSSPMTLFIRLKQAFKIYREAGLNVVLMRALKQSKENNYAEWIEKYDTFSERDYEKISNHITSFSWRPKFSVIMPTYNSDERFLKEAIESVCSQIYPNWELCVADDASTKGSVIDILNQYLQCDSRIKVAFRETNGHIAAATNSALELATGDFVVFLDHDDLLRPHSLYMFAELLNRESESILIYSDEDQLSPDGRRVLPYFKPDFDPELLLSQNYICHLMAIKREIVKKVGGMRDECKGAQDWDLLLRVVSEIDRKKINHIPFVLYHWRQAAGSTAADAVAKPYVFESQKRAVSDYLVREGCLLAEGGVISGAQITDDNLLSATVDVDDRIWQLKVRFSTLKKPKVSIIIPTKDQIELLDLAVASIKKRAGYDNYEVLIVDNNSSLPETFEYFKSLADDPKIKVVKDSGQFNFSRINNDAALLTDGELLLFMNNDVEMRSPDWLGEMVGRISRDDVAAVGGKLLYPSELLQHAGILLGVGGVAGHCFKGLPRSDCGYWNQAILPRTVSGCTAALLLVKRELFEKVGGFDQINLAVSFNDVDLCLKILELGKRVVYTPYAEGYHHESASRGYEHTSLAKTKRAEKEIEHMKVKWGDNLRRDRFYNLNLTLQAEDFALAFPPRVVYPWLD